MFRSQVELLDGRHQSSRVSSGQHCAARRRQRLIRLGDAALFEQPRPGLAFQRRPIRRSSHPY